VLLGQVRAAMDGAAGPRQKTAAAIAAYLRLIEHDPQVYRFVMHRPLADADLVADLVSLIGDQVAEVIAEQLTSAGSDPGPAVPWGHGVVGMVRSAADNWIARPAGMTRDQLADHLTALAWAGLSGVVAHTEEETS
jgi:AcrR family transcriptional regulator